MAAQMTYERIIHRQQLRIQLNFPYQAQWIDKVKSIPDRKWSQSRKCWHIPDTQESFELLKTLFPQARQAENTTVSVPPEEKKAVSDQQQIKNKVYVSILSRKLLLSMENQPKDVNFIKSLQYYRWNNHDFRWEITHTPANHQKSFWRKIAGTRTNC